MLQHWGMQDEVVIHVYYGWHVAARMQDEVVIHTWYGWFFDDTKPQFPRLSSMARQYLTVPDNSESPERLFSSVGLVKSDLRGRLLDTTLIDVMWAK
jgi:hypothetical protein